MSFQNIIRPGDEHKGDILRQRRTLEGGALRSIFKLE
jgi:hypothetical protein